MKCALNGHNTRVLAKAINSFARIGNELYLEATQNGLVLRTVNDSQTAFAVMSFETGFFTDFKIDRSDSDEYCNKCKVSMKSCLGVFKNMRQVEKCQISLNLKTSKLLFQFNCLFDTIKTHNVSILDQESLNAVYMTDNPPNRMTAPNKMFTEIISNFRMYDNEITIEAATDLVVLKNNIDMHTDKHLMRTKLTLKSQEFDGYQISEPTTITFCLKELRAILNFADALSLDMTINFETAGRPVVFAFGSVDMFTANFVMSTLPPDDLSQFNRSTDTEVKKVAKSRENGKNRRNQSDSKNLTINLSDIIDLDADGDVQVPEIVTRATSETITQRDKASPANRTQVDRNLTTMASTLVTQHNPPKDTLNNRQKSCSPSHQSTNTNPVQQQAEKIIPEQRTQGNLFTATAATTVVSQNNPSNTTLNKRRKSCSPSRQSMNTNPGLRQTDSEEICVTFQPESNVASENVDDEMDVIPQSPQPNRRRRFKIFPRLYQHTQYPTQSRVLQANSDEES